MTSEVPSRTLFIRNLPYSISNERLEEVFSDVGPVKTCFVVKDKETSQCRGFGYVTYSLVEDAEKAKETVKVVDDRKIFIHFANKKVREKRGKRKKKDEEEDEDESERPHAKIPEEVPKEVKKESTRKKELKLTELPKEAKKESKKPEKLKAAPKDRPSCRVIVTDIAPKSKKKEVLPVLQLQKNHLQITYPAPGHPEGSAVVFFGSKLEAIQAAQKYNRLKIKGRPLKAVLESQQQKQPTQAKQPKKCRLIIRNLSFKCREPDLKVAFSKFGEVTEVTIPRKPDGKMRGFGFVQYGALSQAAAALKKMNATEIKGRAVAVDWALAKEKYVQATQSVPPVTGKDSSSDDSGSFSAENNHSDEGSDSEEEKEDGDGEAESASEDQSSSSGMDEEEEEEEDGESGSDTSDSDEDEENAGVDSSSAECDDSGSSAAEEEGDEEDEMSSDDEDSEEDDTDKKGSKSRKPLPVSRKADTDEGRTVFIRNLSYNTEEDALEEFFEQFGEISYCRVVVDPQTERSRGTAFVRFVKKEDAEKAAAADQQQQQQQEQEIGMTRAEELKLDGRVLNVTMAVSRDKAEKLQKDKTQKEKKDTRNLHLAREGMIRPGTQSAQGLDKVDLEKRMKVEVVKRQKLKNPNVFISTTRLCVRNLPIGISDKELRSVFSKSAGDAKVKITECRIMRDLARVNAKGEAKSRGYGFVNFADHAHALQALRVTNNAPDVFGEKKRLIVEFSLENKAALLTKERRIQRAEAKHEMLKKDGKSSPGWTFSDRRAKKLKVDQSVAPAPASSSSTTEPSGKKKGAKAMPSHWGPKVRHKSRAPPPSAAKPKDRLSRKQTQDRKRKALDQPQHGQPGQGQGQLPTEPNTKRRRKQKNVQDDVDRLVSQYRHKLTGALHKQSSSKWFDS